MTSEPAPAVREPFAASDADVDLVLELCGDDARDAIRILLDATVQLEAEIAALRAAATRAASRGYIRARPAERG